MSDTIQLYTVQFTSPEYKYLTEYLSSSDSPALYYNNSPDDFLKIIDEYGISNKERIFDAYSESEKIKYANIDARFLLLKIGIKFVIPADKIQRNSLLTQGIEIITNSDVTFKSAALAKLESDKGYVQIEKPIDGHTTNGITKQVVPEVSVWIWCRSLSDKKSINQEDKSDYIMEGEIFDISPFISNITTNVTRQTGGNFQFNLPPLVASLDDNGKWVIEKDSLEIYIEPKNLSLNEQGYVAHASLYDQDMNRKKFLFHNIIGSNDLVFIRYEKLEIEKDKRNVNESLRIDKSEIAGNIFDMIGLVDTDASSLSPSSNDANIVIAGRDLCKLFIEDGSYFFPLEQSGILTFAGGSTQKNSLLQRVYSENALLYFSLYFNNTIENVLKFVIQQLSTISVVPDSLFESYGDRRNVRFNEGDFYKGKPVNYQLITLEKDVKSNIKQLIGNNIFSILGVDDVTSIDQSNIIKLASSLSDSNINTLYNSLKDFVNQLRINKVRKVDGNITIGWGSFTWRNDTVVADSFPDYFIDNNIAIYPFYQNNIADTLLQDSINSIDSILDIEGAASQYTKEFSKELASGIWQIIKLVIDKSVVQRKIVDSSMSSSNGSLINFFRKICQDPFVEFIFDTYGDEYIGTIRKPPTDQLGIISLLEGKVSTEDGTIVTGTPAIIDIEDEDVLREDLYFDDSNIYSWYHLVPRYNILGDDTYSYFYLPALYFEEYASIWGSRPMDLSHNYSVYQPIDPSTGKGIDPSEKQAAYDLKYMVESNQYNPFTRKGTIVINGDRRVKVGNLIRYKPTGEIFTVDAVNQNYKIGANNIDRATTIYVSRGMVEQFIYGVPVEESGDNEKDHIGYFNIINTNLNFQYDKVVNTKTTEDVQYVYPGAQTDYMIAPGFNEYMQHQQGASGMSQIYRASITGGFVSQNRLVGMEQNVFSDYPGGKKNITPKGFIEYWIKRYNKAYKLVSEVKNNKVVNKSQYDYIYAKVSNETGVPFYILKAFGQIESNNKNVGDNGKGYVGVMQLSDAVAKEVGVTDRTDPEQSIRGAAKYYLKHTKNQIFPTQSNDVAKKVVKTINSTETSLALNRNEIFKNFKVNRHVLDFFLRREQFNDKYKAEDISRKIFNANVAKALGE